MNLLLKTKFSLQAKLSSKASIKRPRTVTSIRRMKVVLKCSTLISEIKIQILQFLTVNKCKLL